MLERMCLPTDQLGIQFKIVSFKHLKWTTPHLYFAQTSETDVETGNELVSCKLALGCHQKLSVQEPLPGVLSTYLKLTNFACPL